MGISREQIEAVIRLPAPKRYSHFIKKVVGWKRAWGLFDDGWALLETDDGAAVFPLWPEPEYARLYAHGSWEAYQPQAIELDEIFTDLIPLLREKETLPGIFPTEESGSVHVDIDTLEQDLRVELSRYE
jgi:hypothetical protein